MRHSTGSAYAILSRPTLRVSLSCGWTAEVTFTMEELDLNVKRRVAT